jgi:hypothetical protein
LQTEVLDNTSSQPSQPTKRPIHRFKAGEPSANPHGRPKGSKNKLGQLFIEALYQDFQKHGVETIVKVREKQPTNYLRVIAQLLPQHITIDTNVEISEDQLKRIVAAAQAEQEKRAQARAKAIEQATDTPGALVVYEE